MITIGYGRHRHPLGEANLALDRQTLFNQNQIPEAELCIYQISGTIVGDSVSSIRSQQAQLMQAYSAHNQDILMLDVNGTELPNTMRLQNTRNGIRVVKPPSFPAAQGAEYVTFLPFSITLECEIPITTDTYLRFFTESISQSGGGARYGIIEPNIGKPIRQRIKEQSAYRYTQSGQAVGIYGYPDIPRPLFPDYLLEQPKITRTAPGRYGFGIGISYENYTVTWQYEFASDRDLRPTPNRWI